MTNLVDWERLSNKAIDFFVTFLCDLDEEIKFDEAPILFKEALQEAIKRQRALLKELKQISVSVLKKPSDNPWADYRYFVKPENERAFLNLVEQLLGYPCIEERDNPKDDGLLIFDIDLEFDYREWER